MRYGDEGGWKAEGLGRRGWVGRGEGLRADIDEHLAEDEHDQGDLGGDAVEVVVGAIFPEGVACCEEHGAEGMETEELPCFVATGTCGLEGINSKPGVSEHRWRLTSIARCGRRPRAHTSR